MKTGNIAESKLWATEFETGEAHIHTRALWCMFITIIIVGVPRLLDAHAPTVFGRHIEAG